METFKSELNGRNYRVSDIARVPDKTLQTLYIKAGLKPIEVIPGLDRNNNDIIIMYFSKKESQPYFEKWKNHELSDFLADNE